MAQTETGPFYAAFYFVKRTRHKEVLHNCQNQIGTNGRAASHVSNHHISGWFFAQVRVIGQFSCDGHQGDCSLQTGLENLQSFLNLHWQMAKPRMDIMVDVTHGQIEGDHNCFDVPS